MKKIVEKTMADWIKLILDSEGRPNYLRIVLIFVFLGVLTNLDFVVNSFFGGFWHIQSMEQRVIEKKIDGALASINVLAQKYEEHIKESKNMNDKIEQNRLDINTNETKLEAQIQELKYLRDRVNTLRNTKVYQNDEE